MKLPGSSWERSGWITMVSQVGDFDSCDKRKRFSIVMPVYNNEKYFPLAVKSVTDQDYPDWELIIIDDGSTDCTPSIADEMAKEDARIKVIHQTNQWIYASFNRGVAEAKGEYVYIVNSDDRLRQGSLALMAYKIEKYHPDVIWTNILIHECDKDQNIIVYDKGNTGKRVKEELFCRNVKEVREHWPYFLFSSLAQNQANLYRRELMQRHKFRNDVYGADTLFNISIARDVRSALVIKEPVYDFFIYRQDGMNASSGKYYSYEHEMFNEIYKGYMDVFTEWKLPEQSYRGQLISRRLSEVTREIRTLSFSNCKMTTEEKIKHILCKTADQVVIDCARLERKEEELESRILSGLRELLIKEPIGEDSEMYFTYELLESLLRYEKDEEDFQKIRNAIENPYNPHHIGAAFYRKIAGEEDR